MLSRSDEIDLLTELHDGVHEEPRWATFLARMQRRTRADHVSLIVGQSDVPIHRAMQWFAGRDMRAQVGQLEHLARLDPTPYHRLRPGRVYAANELIDPDDARHSRFRREYLDRIGIRYGRFMRIIETGGRSAWLSVTRAADDFTAADSALLSSLAPHLAIALRTLVKLDRLCLQAATADNALRRAGIGWAMMDRDARPIGHGGAMVTGNRGAAEPVRASPAMAIDGGTTLDILPSLAVEHLTGAATTPVMLTLVRRPPVLGMAAEAALSRTYGLSPKEAALAIQLANGESLIDAAKSLRLSTETTRNYSKRLFAKTGTRGQADLVRLIWTSAASLA